MKRSKKCEKGFHANLTAEEMRGRTVSSSNPLCAGYAGAVACECPCHDKVTNTLGGRF